MRIRLTVLMTLGLGLAAGCGAKPSVGPPPPAPPLLGSYHFVGFSQLATNTNAATLKTIWNLPASRTLVDRTLDKIARTPLTWLTPAGSPGAATLVRPLLDDLLHAESYGEWRGQTNRVVEWTLAARMSDTRARLWQTNCWQLLAAGTPGNCTATNVGGFAGWEARDPHGPDRFRFVRAGDWTVIGAGRDGLLGQTEALSRTNRWPWADSSNAWLEARIDLARLNAFWPGPAPIPAPAVRLTVTSQAGDLRSDLNLVFPSAIDWRVRPWQVPTNIIRQPLISFTALQGLAPWLSQCPAVKQLQLTSLPDQLFIWAQHSPIPVQTFVAMPVADASNVLDQLANRLPTLVLTNLEQHHLGRILRMTNRAELGWAGLPFIFPSLAVTNESSGPVLLGQIFPPLPGTNPPPAELIAQVTGRTNLLYYDWEITQERLGQWQAMSQLYSIIVSAWRQSEISASTGRTNVPAPVPVFDTNAPTRQWVTAAAPFLGNSITRLTITSPRELTLARKAPLGLTGFELVLLIRWLDDPAFPGFSSAWAGVESDLPAAPDRDAGPPRQPSNAQTGR